MHYGFPPERWESKVREFEYLLFKYNGIDGTKIEANANRYTFVWAKTVEKNLQKLNAKINNELPDLCQKIRIVGICFIGRCN